MNFPVNTVDPSVRALGAKVGQDRARDLASLKKNAEALEALFVQQLFSVMRQGVPSDGILDKGPGEDLFSSMLDQTVSETVATRSTGPHDLSTSLFDALRSRLGSPADTAR